MAKVMFCANCGTQGKPKKKTPGSFLIELVLWLFFIVPGLIYSVWRVSSKKQVCPACGAEHMVPLSSPVAQRALAHR